MSMVPAAFVEVVRARIFDIILSSPRERNFARRDYLAIACLARKYFIQSTMVFVNLFIEALRARDATPRGNLAIRGNAVTRNCVWADFRTSHHRVTLA